MFRQVVHYLAEHMAMVQNAMSSNAFSILLDILADEIRVSFLEELSKGGSAKILETVQPEFAASYYSGGIIQILRQWMTSKKALSEEVLVEQYTALLGTFMA